jgi:NTP pyrophosphatase (non-canonical NTP hydrolase)
LLSAALQATEAISHSPFAIKKPVSMSHDTLTKLTQEIIDFRDARDWKQFHNPKDLATALSIEASELQEIFLWKNGAALEEALIAKREHIEQEVADIASYLLLLCSQLDIDLDQAIRKKLELNKAKYPADQVRGSSQKYDEYKEK